MKSITKPAKKTGLIVLICALLAACIYFGIAAKIHIWPFPMQPRSGSGTPSQVDNETANPKTLVNSSGSQKTSQDVPVSATMTAAITELSEDDNGLITFAGTVSGSSEAGTCVITFTNPNDKPYVQQVDSTNKAGVDTCGPIKISSLNFSYLGEWTATFRFYNDKQQATTTSSIEIK